MLFLLVQDQQRVFLRRFVVIMRDRYDTVGAVPFISRAPMVQLYILHRSINTPCSETENMDRSALDQRRLEEAHMRFCILDVLQRYPQLCPNFKGTIQRSTRTRAISVIFF